MGGKLGIGDAEGVQNFLTGFVSSTFGEKGTAKFPGCINVFVRPLTIWWYGAMVNTLHCHCRNRSSILLITAINITKLVAKTISQSLQVRRLGRKV